jgi:hypothetical protein
VELDVSDNRLTELPPFVVMLPKLARLAAANNRLRFVPLELAGAEALESIDLTGNSELAQVHPLARGNAKLVRWICAQEVGSAQRAYELAGRVGDLEAANRALEFERAERGEKLAAVTRERDDLLAALPRAYLDMRAALRSCGCSVM